jgi:hypothetical protein
MRKLLLGVATLLATLSANAIDDNNVVITYDGSTAKVEIASNISSYVTCSSGTSSHVKLIQSDNVSEKVGEILYTLKGSSSNGEFFMEGSYKSTLVLDGLTLTNPDSTAIHIKNGKRIKVSLANGTTNTLADGSSNLDSKGCFHCKGHTEFVGKGTLNISSNIRHAIYSKEYLTVKNCTINVSGAKKDAIHCQQYFLMQSGTINISSADDDGIEVEYKDATNPTGVKTNHEDEDSGNFYMTGGTLSITSVGSYCIQTDGTISITGGTKDFNTANVLENAATGINTVKTNAFDSNGDEVVYDLNGRRLPKGTRKKGLVIKGGHVVQER